MQTRPESENMHEISFLVENVANIQLEFLLWGIHEFFGEDRFDLVFFFISSLFISEFFAFSRTPYLVYSFLPLFFFY